MRALPPNGFWIVERDHQIAVHGWDWTAGATTLLHGIVTLPVAIWWSGKPVPAVAAWLLLALVVAGGVGFRIVVDARGLSLSRTWMGWPLWTRKLPEGTPVGVGHDPYAAEGADHVSFVAIGGQQVGNASNAASIAKALRTAQTRLAQQP